MKWLKKNQHLILAYMWLLLAIPTFLWWSESVLWIAFLSLYANFESSRAAHLARKKEQSK